MNEKELLRIWGGFESEENIYLFRHGTIQMDRIRAGCSEPNRRAGQLDGPLV